MAEVAGAAVEAVVAAAEVVVAVAAIMAGKGADLNDESSVQRENMLYTGTYRMIQYGPTCPSEAVSSFTLIDAHFCVAFIHCKPPTTPFIF